MFFLIRCVFWLTVVFMTIFSQDPIRRAPVAQEYSRAQAVQRARIGDLAQTWISAAVSLIERKAVDRRGKADCLAKTANLSDTGHFLAGAPAPEVSARAQAVPQPAAQVPLPPRRPLFLSAKSIRAGEIVARGICYGAFRPELTPLCAA